MNLTFRSLLALACCLTAACGSDKAVGPDFPPEPSPSSVPPYKIAYTTISPASVVVTETGKANRTVEMPAPFGAQNPTLPYWSPSGTKLAFTALSSSEQSLHVWDAQTGSVIKLLSIIPAVACIKGSCSIVELPFNVAWSPDGNRLAFLVRGTLRVAAFDGSGTTTISSPNAPAVPNTLQWTRDGAALLFGSSDAVYSVPVSGAAAFTTVLTGLTGFVQGMELSPDGKKLAVATTENLYIRDIPAGTTTTSVGGSFFAPAWSADGKNLALSRSQGLYVISAAGTSEIRITTDITFSRVAWLPDGANLVFSGSQSRGLAIANVQGGGVQLLGVPAALSFSVASK